MPDNVLWRLNGYGTMGTMRLNELRVKYGLDYFLDHFFGLFFWTIFFLDHFFFWTISQGGGKHTISTQGSVGCSLLVPRKG